MYGSPFLPLQSLARERLRGRVSLSVFSFHHLCVWWGEKISPSCTNALKNCRIRMEKTFTFTLYNFIWIK